MNKENLEKMSEIYSAKITKITEETSCSVRVMASMGAKLDKQIKEIEQLEAFLNEVCDHLEILQKEEEERDE